MMNTNEIGQRGEWIAEQFLEEQGLIIIEKNVHSRFGEIDLIATDNQKNIIFIEVRVRKNNRYGSALESVTLQKQKRFLQTVETYLQKNPLYYSLNPRIDVIGITGDLSTPKIEWIQNAFSH